MGGEALPSVDRTRRERDLYYGLLTLDTTSDVSAFLQSALKLICDIVGAKQGYLELAPNDAPGMVFWHATGFTDEEANAVRSTVSRGIIAEAIAREQPILTPSALLDPRFRDRASVQRSKVDAVLCAPIGHDPPIGVLYLQGSKSIASMDEHDVAQVVLFARKLTVVAEPLLQRLRGERITGLSALRAKLNAEDLIGDSAAMHALLKEVALSAPLDVGVLLLGETGTGKTHVARLIHRNSRRARGPFVELNCAALPDQLLESELFGALPGAHSTATRRVDGRVSAASGGTLLLDEVSELSPAAQAKILQFLQSKQFYRLGSSRIEMADVRILAAANVDLERAVSEKRFREDLYYRLQVLTIRVPSVSDRKEDKRLLAEHFCVRAKKAHGLPAVELSPACLRAIEASEWPGNVRQLGHAVEAAVIRASSSGLRHVEASHVFPGGTGGPTRSSTPSFQEETRRFQRQLVLAALDELDWNVTAAARHLDLTRSHLYNLIKSFGLQRDSV